MRWCFVTDQPWNTAHTLWDEPVEIDSAWHEEALPPPEYRWARNWDAEYDALAARRARSHLRAWLRRLAQVLVRRRAGAAGKMEVDGHISQAARPARSSSS